MSCIALYYRAILNVRIFADFRSKIDFRDFDRRISQVKYDQIQSLFHIFISTMPMRIHNISLTRQIRLT